METKLTQDTIKQRYLMNCYNQDVCYHQSRKMFDEFEDGDGKIYYEDVEVCRECKMVIFNDKEMGYNYD